VLSPRKPDIRNAAAPTRFGGLHNGFARSPQLRQSTTARAPPGSPKLEVGVGDIGPAPGSPSSGDHDGVAADNVTQWDEHSEVSSSFKPVLANQPDRLPCL